MNITVEDIFKHSFVINVSPKRKEQFFDSFNQTGIINKPTVYPGFRLKNYKLWYFIKKNNIINCTFSHISIINMAKILDLPYVCVFEDDAIFVKNFKDKLQKYLDELPNDAYGLWFGFQHIHGKVGSTAYIFFKKYYDIAIEIINNEDPIVDHKYLKNNYIKTTKEILNLQYDTYSYITERERVDRSIEKYGEKLNNFYLPNNKKTNENSIY